MKTKLLTMLVLILAAISCGDEKNYYTEEIVNATNENSDFSGYYVLSGPDEDTYNCIRLTQKSESLVDVESECQSLLTTNPENGTVGQFPTISQSNVLIVNGELRFTRNLNYTSGNDIEEDKSGSNITGQRRTDVRIFFEDDLLKVNITVYGNSNNNNLNDIDAERSFTEIR